MELLLYCLALLSLSVLHSLQPASGQGVSLEHKGNLVPSFGLLEHSEIDVSTNLLICRTDNTSCCRGLDNPNGGGFGDWYYPDGSVVHFTFELDLPPDQIYRMQRNTRTIQLHRVGSATVSTANGIYRCVVADQNGVNQTRYVGLYTDGDGAVSIPQAPQFSNTSTDPLEFTLTVTTTGGPPTTAFWTLPNGANVTAAADSFSQRVVDAMNSTVEHTLTVTDGLAGEYTFTTANNRNGSFSMSITVEAPPVTAPTSAPPTTTPAPVTVSVAISGPDTGVAGEQYNLTCIATVGGTGDNPVFVWQDSDNANISQGDGVTITPGSGSSSVLSFSSLTSTYDEGTITCHVTVGSVTESNSTIIRVRQFLDPTVTTEIINSTSIRVTFTPPSGGSLPAESYDIQYTRVTGAGQTLCGGVEDTGSATNVESPYTIGNLYEFSIYSFTVTAFAFGVMRENTDQAMTSPAVPSGSPQSQSVVMSLVNSSSITVQWGRVRCIDRNSVITGYTVRYGQSGSTTATMTVSGTGASNRMFIANGLLPRTSYTFEVAAVSSEGTGPFSTGTTAETTVPEGVALQLSGQRYGNNSLVTLTDIGEEDSAALLCLTDREQCCRGIDNDNGGALGGWYFPNNGSALLFGFDDVSIFQNRGASRVRLNRRNNAQSPTGLYRCEVPDASRMDHDQSIYVGVIGNGNNEGTPTISAIQFELTSATNAHTPSFNLHCITMGGPVDFSDITWTRAGSSLPASHGLFQVLVNGVTATYNNTLAVVGRETGQYTCHLQPPGGSSLSRMIIVGAANPPSGLMVAQSGLTSVTVSWTAPAPRGAMRTGYRIFYSGGSEQSVEIGADATSHTLTGLQSGAIYRISVVALSNTLPSTVLGPEMVTVEVLEAPVVMTEVLSPTSIRVTFTQSSGSFAAESHDIQYTRVVGAGQQLCPNRDSPDDAMTVTNITSPHDITSLQEFSTYDITITAVFSGAMIPKTVQSTTLVAAPTVAPRDLMNTTVLSTSITVGWNPVECIERNGVIVNYIVRFGPEDGVQSDNTVQSDGIDQPGTYTASELTPFTRYSFEVAAMTSVGRGLFTGPLTVVTNAVSPPTGLTAVQSGLTSVLVSWTAPASDSSVITGYRITYNTNGGSEHSVDVGAGATNHTLIDLQNETYSISIVALIDTSSSSVAGPVMETVRGTQISGETTLQSGQSYSINCTSDLEVDNIRWLDDAGDTIKEGNDSFLILQLNDVTSSLNGAIYTCRINSSYGVQERSITLSVSASSSAVAVGAAVGVIVAIVAVLVLITVILCIACRMKRRGRFTLFDKVYSKPKTHQSYGIPYNISGSGFGDSGTIELKEVKEEVHGNDDDYFEDPATIVKDRTRPIPLSQFGAHVRRMHHDRDKKFELEFDSLIKHPQSSVDIAQIPYNRERNRFGNIFPYNQNRVLLSEIPGVDGSDYINASYIEGYNETENAYIAAQGPMPNSVGDFWRMIWENKLPTVVMLTRCFEGKPKCERYWPETLESKLNLKNNLVVSMTEVLPFTEYEIRKLEVHDTSKPSECPLKVTQLHYTIWPDHGVPTNAMSVINFIKRVRRTHPVGRASGCPLVVHCSAGVGRTGTFIVLDVMLQRIKDVDNVNVYKFITELRTQRVFMVQSQSQYVFIHDAIDELITCGETEIAATDIRLTINKLTAFGDGGKSGFQKQFQNLQQVSPKPKDIDLKSARNPQNVSKNRYQENIVNDLTRVRISPSGRACTDYINAAFVDGYRKRGAYISAQGPMKETVNDFWKMIKEFQSRCIVMLCKLNENGESSFAVQESCYCYWPTGNGASEVYGKLKVTLISQETCTDYVVRRLEVTDEKQRTSGLAADGGSFIVTQFHLSRWAPHSTPSTFALLEVVTKMTKVQMTSGNKAITVMCNDGVGRTGAFIAIHTQLERLKTEGLVDVFQCIKSARLQRAGLVHSLEQYIFCHNVLEDFLDSFDTYANFKELV